MIKATNVEHVDISFSDMLEFEMYIIVSKYGYSGETVIRIDEKVYSLADGLTKDNTREWGIEAAHRVILAQAGHKVVLTQS